ncbi:MAG: hypothetical protein GOP50_00770 [Candidatus Heimdallarchaeota archaeon]|nr:hypothetical protein [Candidatus Heimdallarchaeota archaeon]
MPDILSSEKSEIRAMAQRYAQSLWTIPFDKGIVAYVKTNNELFVHPARWRFCFKCGMILKTSLSKKVEPNDETTDHSCILEFEEVPLLIKTSWFQLRKFFLEKKTHNKILQEIGLSELPKAVLITESSKKLEIAEKVTSETVTEESL